jgi:hypothetical protein
MATLRERIEEDMKVAAKAQDKLRLSVLRLLKSAVMYREIEIGKALDDGGITSVIQSLVKQRRDSIDQYKAGGRDDLADKEQQETVMLQGYLPQALAPEELSAKVDDAIAKTGAKGPKDMGAVMKALLDPAAGVAGRAENRTVSELVKSRLAAKAQA